MRKTSHIAIPDDLRERLVRLAERILVPVKRKKTHRPANLTELLVLGAARVARDLEAGRDVFQGAQTLHGAIQTHEGRTVTLAPLASAEIYAELAATPNIPAAGHQDALDADASLIGAGTRVRVRGTVYHTDEKLDGYEGIVVAAARGRADPKVQFDNGPPVEVSAYDLIPAVLWGQQVRAFGFGGE